MLVTMWCEGSSRTAINVTYRHTFPNTGQCAFCGRVVKATLDSRVRRHVDERACGINKHNLRVVTI
jgi:hypothetical protein